ncbi:MAG: hypothetical protein WAL24_02830 [Nitrososphaeraceae archaeon]
MELKATNENGKTNKVSDFRLSADNVLFIEQNDKVTITDNVDFTRALVTDSNDNEKRIGVSSSGVIDFAGYAQGIYTLDVVVDDSRAYEAIIVIGEQDEQVVDREITRVNNKQITEIEIITIFEIEEDNDNNDDNADDGLPYCDLVAESYKGGCFDRTDNDEGGPFSCRDGSRVEDWRDCKDAGKHPDEQVQRIGDDLGNLMETEDDGPEPEPTLFGSSTSTPTPAPTPNALERGLLPTTPTPTLDNPCEAIPEPDIPEYRDLPAETPEPTPLPPTPTEESQILPFYPDEKYCRHT